MIGACARILLAAVWFPAAQAAIVVAYESGIEAYAQALQGVTEGLKPNAVLAVDLRGPGGGRDLARALAAADTRLVVALGSHALAEVRGLNAPARVVAAMVLHGGTAGPGGRVELDISLATQLGALRELYPRHSRVGMIRNPATSRYSAEWLESHARKEGFTAVVVECAGPAQLLKAVAALRGKVDFLLCFPDPELYNTVTIQPLVLAALEQRLPLVGFSSAFVRAGAAAGIYPDYRDVGLQAAEMALRQVRGEDRGGEEGPRKVLVAVNQRVLRLLGIEFGRTTTPVEVFR